MDGTGAGRVSRIDLRAASVGLVAAVMLQLLGSSVVFGGRAGNPFAQGVLTFSALLVGGFLAGWLGPVAGSAWNGTVVAIGFIAVAALARTILETQLARTVGPLALGSSDMTGLIVGDLVELSGGTLGGWLSRRTRTLIHR